MSYKGYFRHLHDRAKYSGRYAKMPKGVRQFFVFKDGKMVETVMGKESDRERITTEMIEKYGPDIFVS